MIKIIIWGLIIVGLILLAKRISRILTVSLVFIISVFLALFLLDTFTIIDLRSHLPFMKQYDKTLDDPKGVAKDVKEKVYGTGEGAITRINVKADKLDKEYGTETDSQKEARETEEKTTEIEEETTEIEEETTEIEEETKKDKKQEETEDESGKIFEETSSKHFIKYTEFYEVMEKQYPNITSKDENIAMSVTSNLVVDFKGENYRIWNEADKPEGFYMQKIK